MDCSKSKSTLNKDVTQFVQWMKSEMRSKATQKSEVYNFDFLSDAPLKKTCKRLSWVATTHEFSPEGSALHNTLPEFGILNS